MLNEEKIALLNVGDELYVGVIYKQRILYRHAKFLSYDPETRIFSLLEAHDFEIPETKIYGQHLDKVKKVLNSMDKMNRNLGVILSGDKGIGKSLFFKCLGLKARKKRDTCYIG